VGEMQDGDTYLATAHLMRLGLLSAVWHRRRRAPMPHTDFARQTCK